MNVSKSMSMKQFLKTDVAIRVCNFAQLEVLSIEFENPDYRDDVVNLLCRCVHTSKVNSYIVETSKVDAKPVPITFKDTWYLKTSGE